jgi:methionyl-tRNA synthetase
VLKFSQNLIEELKPRAITRDLDWGVPIPLPGLERPHRQAHLRLVRRRHRLPVGVGGVGPAQRRPRGLAPVLVTGRDGRYFMGKDNVVFHSVIWPAILLGASGKPEGQPGRSASWSCRARW